MLKSLIEKHGKLKINSLTKYPSILTLHKFGERGRLTNDVTTDIIGEKMFATEKIDGTNVRIVCLGDEYLIGSREHILHYHTDFYFDTAQGIVEGVRELKVKIPQTTDLTVIYGELFGGKMSSNAKQYGTDKIGFRVFDIAVFLDLSILDMELEDISKWRETETTDGIIYGQNFLNSEELSVYASQFDIVPSVHFEISDLSHRTILDSLKKCLPKTLVALSDSALMRPEGVILRNANRSKIIKLRFEEYERTLR